MRTRKENERINEAFRKFLLENCLNECGEVEINGFEFDGHIIFDNWEINGDFYNGNLRAKEIVQNGQEAKRIEQGFQIADEIYQGYQEAKYIMQSNQKANHIEQDTIDNDDDY